MCSVVRRGPAPVGQTSSPSFPLAAEHQRGRGYPRHGIQAVPPPPPNDAAYPYADPAAVLAPDAVGESRSRDHAVLSSERDDLVPGGARAGVLAPTAFSPEVLNKKKSYVFQAFQKQKGQFSSRFQEKNKETHPFENLDFPPDPFSATYIQ